MPLQSPINSGVKSGLSICLALAALGGLSGCSMSSSDGDPDTVYRKTISYNRTRIGDGPAQVTRTVTEGNVKIERSREYAYQGNYWLKDNGDRECVFFLSSAPLDDDRFATRLTNDCSNGMRNIAAWRLVEEMIMLLNADGDPIGGFNPVGGRRYSGTFLLTTGQSHPATLLKDI